MPQKLKMISHAVCLSKLIWRTNDQHDKNYSNSPSDKIKITQIYWSTTVLN